MFNSAPNSGFLTWESMGIDSFLEPASSGHPVNCSFLHFRIGLIAQPRMLPLEKNLLMLMVLQDMEDQVLPGLKRSCERAGEQTDDEGH